MGKIEWPAHNVFSDMTVNVKDNTDLPRRVLDASEDTIVNIQWTVPAVYQQVIGGYFRLRVFAESIGPGQEIQIGDEKFVPANSDANYTTDIKIPGGTLRGEGEFHDGKLVSGIYKIVGVLQHTNPSKSPADANEVSGFDEVTLRMFRTP